MLVYKVFKGFLCVCFSALRLPPSSEQSVLRRQDSWKPEPQNNLQQLLKPPFLKHSPGSRPIHAGKFSWGDNFCANTHSHSCEYRRKMFLRNYSRCVCQILGGTHCGAKTCRACIRIRANRGRISWQIMYVLVSCQGIDYVI